MSGFQVGYRVRVLRGRQFGDFKERDEGVILDINEECRNCTVVFDGRPDKVQVALKHLRVIGHSNNGTAQDAGARSQKVLAKQIAEEMRLADLPAVQALDAELQELRNALETAQKKLKSYEAKDEKQAQEILQLTKELSTVKQEELQADLAVARVEAASQEMMAQVAMDRHELAQEQMLVESLRKQLEDAPQREAKLQKEVELLRSEYQALAAKDSTSAWNEEAAACENLRAEMAAEQARRELEAAQASAGPGAEIPEDVQKALFKAAAEGSLAAALAQLHLGFNEALECHLPDGTTLLHVALEAAPAAMVAQLQQHREQQHFEHTLKMQLEDQQQITTLNRRGGPRQQTPLQLHCASPESTKKSVMQLLELHADPSVKDLDGSTVFLDCATQGRCELVLALLQYSGDFLPYELDGRNRSALHRAAENGHAEVAQLLMQASVPVDAVDDDGRTALDYARMHQQAEVMKLLDPKAFETSQLEQRGFPTEVPQPPQAQAEGEHAEPVHTFEPRNASAWEASHGPEATVFAGEPQVFGPTAPAATPPTVCPETLHAPRAFASPFPIGHLGAAFGNMVPTEGPSVADHFNVYGAAAPQVHHRSDTPQSVGHGVPIEGPTAGDHLNVFGAGRSGGTPPPPPRGMGFRSASDTRLSDRLYGTNSSHAGSDDRLGERSKSLGRRAGGRRISAFTVAPRNLSGVEALREKDKDFGGRRSRPKAPPESPDLEATVTRTDAQEGDPLRKRLNKRPNWSSQQVSPGRRADECDDEPSWGSWF